MEGIFNYTYSLDINSTFSLYENIGPYEGRQLGHHEKFTVVWLAIAAVLALVTNVFLLYLVIANQTLRMHTYSFVACLATFGILDAFWLGATSVTFYVDKWVFGRHVCKMFTMLSVFTQMGVEFTQVLMCAERVYKGFQIQGKQIAGPVRNSSMPWWFAFIAVGISLTLTIPFVVTQGVYTDTIQHDAYEVCIDMWPSSGDQLIFGAVLLVVSYVIPLMTIFVLFTLMVFLWTKVKRPSITQHTAGTIQMKDFDDQTAHTGDADENSDEWRRNTILVFILTAVYHILCSLRTGVYLILSIFTYHDTVIIVFYTAMNMYAVSTYVSLIVCLVADSRFRKACLLVFQNFQKISCGK